MASRWLHLYWVQSLLCVLLMVETVSGARGLSTGAHLTPQFPAVGVNQTPVKDCRDVCSLNASDRCDFIRTNPDCYSGEGYLDYLQGIFCHFPPALLPLAVTLYVFWLFYLFLILGVTAAKFFCPNLSAISTTLKLSHNVAGVTFLAFGNGAPDIFSALVAFSDPRTAGLAIGALFGAGVLVTTVVAGGIAALHPFTAASRPFLRDIIFYMVAVFLTFTMLFRGRVTLPWALGYLGLYVFYVITVILCTWIYQWQRRKSLTYSVPRTPEILSDSEEDQVSSNTSSYDYGDEYRPLLSSQETTAQILAQGLNPLDHRRWRSKSVYWRVLKVFKLPVEFLLLLTVPVVDPDRDDRNWKRPLNCLHLVISPLVLVLTLQSGAYGVYEIGGLLPVWAVVVIVGTALASVTFFATSNSEPPKFHWLFAFLGFLTSALWINAAATEVVNILRSLGVVFRLSNTVLGLTLLAWGNSIGDVFSDFTLARQGYPRMAFSACFGGIIFNILVGVGLGCLLQITRSHMEVKLEPDGLLVWVLAGALGLSLVFSLVSVPVQCFQLSKVYGFCLLLFYLNFLVVALLTEFGVIHLKSI
ncbi:mitochondrial sodium/calcium exchanger protein isoform X1 [Nycticebus coucang]|uniref:mitochondrial sodium/calcium exchanger protein isoform X1 n=1 Tax=Nycticebus coucang TaxID=9470 RepID=UPI00234CA49E|nr:mitochondrial sodium/calcium exchanger protein isoform X1 [Nycticebus coucang]XP_053443215.1 mitochondrial sodium/calcium exchanger protein isoform X1 [Nycticebus coucang]XP_053443216.1 mitochondrial sodium/calcium exchanger protein isoform X1 [Nycticebus coucang]XP_053443217.1 mitochondrial sodium/calcium exchanger protein isoform X1 [Nycticebus coucang]XP_053443218.1 mitochondrial sodium/calcium exchanger protein isoform X1 [Nycticebus coucang]